MTSLFAQARNAGIILALCWLLAPLSAGAAEVAVPPLQMRVTDLTQTLSAEQQASLNASLEAFERRKGSQIAVLLVSTTQPETVEQYSIRVAEVWKLGRKGVDDGVLVLVAKNDRTVRIEVGYGLEGALPDAVANRIIREVIVPRFRDGDFYLGLVEGVDRIIKVIDGEPLPEPARQRNDEGAGDAIGRILPILFIGIAIGSSVLRALFGRFGAATLSGAGVGVLVWVVLNTVVGAVIAALFAFFFVIGSGGGRGGWTHGPRGWSGGVGGWRGGGNSWGGGFGGGGGGFGGGGASGRW